MCCPVDTYGPDTAGDLRPECSCGDGCGCMCLNCDCAGWGEEYDDE